MGQHFDISLVSRVASDEESPLLPSRCESKPENSTKRRHDKLAVYDSFIGKHNVTTGGHSIAFLTVSCRHLPRSRGRIYRPFHVEPDRIAVSPSFTGVVAARCL